MSTDNFGALGADFFIKTYDKGSTMSQADLDALVQYVQLTTTIMAIGEFTPNEQDSVWMILERVDVPSAPGYTVTNNTDVTMTSGGLVTIDSMPWTKITGKPDFFSGAYADLTGKPAAQILQAPQWNALHNLGTGNRYLVGDLVYDNGTIYQAILTNESQYTAVGDATYWRNLGSGIRLQTDYLDLANKPTLFSGSYTDLTSKPTIPTSFSSLVNGSFTASLGTDGTLTLPAGGTITEGGGISGAIRLTPAGGANEYQALLIYPTAAGDGDHIHLTAGGGTTELYLGNDLHFVKLESDGNIRIQADNGVNGAAWTFGTDGTLTLPAGGDILDSNGASVLGGGGTTLPADASGYLVNDGTGALSWAAGDGTFSGAYADLTGKPTLFDGDYNSLTNKPTYRIAVATGSGPGGNLQADSLALAGLNPVTDIPSTWGGDLILQGGVGGANGDLYGEVRIKSGQIGANYEWHFTTDKKIKLPAGGDIVNSTGTSVMGGSGSYAPANAGNWAGTAPTTIAEALDRVAVKLAYLSDQGYGPRP